MKKRLFLLALLTSLSLTGCDILDSLPSGVTPPSGDTDKGGEDELSIESISIFGSLRQDKYKVGEEWDPNGLNVKAVYSDGSDKTLKSSDYTFSFEPEAPEVGTTTLIVTATLKDDEKIVSKPNEQQVSVIGPLGIEITGDLQNKEYEEGDEWDPTGLDVFINYSDYTSEQLEVDEYYLEFEPESATKGTTSVSIVAHDIQGFESKPVSINVNVKDSTGPKEKELIKLEIRGNLTYTSYKDDESWKHDGLFVYGIYDDESEELFDNSKYQFIDNPSSPAYAGIGESKLTIRAKLVGGSLESASKEFTVTVSEKTPSTDEYTVTFNANGGSGTMSSQKTSNKSFVVPECSFTKAGYTFTNWAYNSKSGVSYTPGEKINNVSSNFTLYAIWQQNSPSGDTYYAACEGLTGSSLQAKLKDINAPKSPSYDWSRYEDADEALDDPTSILCVYTRHNIKKDSHCGGYAWDKWNREHVWTQSKFPASDTDNHNIFACEGQINNYRGNLPFDEGGSVVTVFGHETECKMVKNTSFEPCDAAKGEIARSVMYGTVMYSYTMTQEIKSIALALKWHLEHAITERETKRNEIVYGNQKNRNPFVDHPEYACKIWGSTNSETKKLCGM